MDDVLKGGPWFVGQHFLAIRQWEPEFKASQATCSSVSVWMRLPELPIEFYDPVMLKKVGSTIGPVSRIDAHTVNGARGRFARICVQITIDKPLINSIKIRKMVQPVQYEGIHMLCFACGRISHWKECCPSLVKGPTLGVDNQVNGSPETNSSPKKASTIGIGQGDGKDDADDVY